MSLSKRRPSRNHGEDVAVEADGPHAVAPTNLDEEAVVMLAEGVRVEREAVGSGDLEGIRDELPEAGDGVGVDRTVSIVGIAVLHPSRTAIPRAPRKQTTFACSILGDELYTHVDTSFSGGAAKAPRGHWDEHPPTPLTWTAE